MKSKQENWKNRLHTLLLAVQDVAPKDHPMPISIEKAGQVHKALFKEYIKELREAKKYAEERWERMIKIQEERVRGGRDKAIRTVKARHPGGPVSDSRVLGTIRKFWLECSRLNQTIENPAERVPPEDPILRWLMDGKHAELTEFLSGLTYWPLGLDQEGHWV
jgi:hypothetical protein